MAKHLFLIHGRSFKPARKTLEANWSEAIEHGLERDGHEDGLRSFRDLRRTFVYYGDISNAFLRNIGEEYDEAADAADRAECLEGLKTYARNGFLGDEGERNYRNLPDADSLKEGLADVFGGLFDVVRLAEPLIRWYAKDVAHYWEPDAGFGSEIRWKLTEPLCDALLGGDDILLVAHSLGTMVSYDVLWKFSWYGEYRDLRSANPTPLSFVTLGSPLGNETVKRNLKGRNADGARRYPSLIRAWHNLAAEDDYISHEETLADDFRKMEREHKMEPIDDRRLYNLAVRHGKSNPHHGAGYLIHPVFVDILAGWLET